MTVPKGRPRGKPRRRKPPRLPAAAPLPAVRGPGAPQPRPSRPQAAPPSRNDWRALTEAVRIVHADREVAVAEKPAGMATVRYEGPDAETGPRRGRDAGPPVLDALVAQLLARRDAGHAPGKRPGAKSRRPGRPRPLRIVQRLDLGTSGLVVFARTIPAERALGTQFRRHSVQRSYLALVHGALAGPRRFDSLFVENRGDGLRGSHPSRGKRAVTHVRPVEWLGAYTLIECRLETGRTHQIRIHLAEAGHPLCGETVYHRPRFGQAPPDSSGAPRIMLHALELGFRHPQSDAALHFTMEPPADFREFLDKLRRTARQAP